MKGEQENREERSLEGSREGLLKSSRGETKLMTTGSKGKKWRKLQVSRSVQSQVTEVGPTRP